MKQTLKQKLKPMLGVASALAIACAFAPSAFAAQSQSSAMLLQANIDAQCQINANQFSIPTMSLTAEFDSPTAGQATVTCNTGTAYTISIDQGVNFGKDPLHPTSNAMSDGQNHYIGYDLFQDSSLTTPWGTGANAYSGVAVNANGLGDQIGFGMKIYDANVNPAGSYGDGVQVTVSW